MSEKANIEFAKKELGKIFSSKIQTQRKSVKTTIPCINSADIHALSNLMINNAFDTIIKRSGTSVTIIVTL